MQPVNEFSSDHQFAADSQSTTTLNHPSQDLFMYSEESKELFEQEEQKYKDRECQTNLMKTTRFHEQSTTVL